MIAFISILAEVGDKVPRLPVVFMWSAFIALLAWALIRKKKWLAIIPGVLAGLFAVAATAETRDPFVGPAIVGELGYGYVGLCYFAAAIPIVVIVALLLRKETEPNQSSQRNAMARPISVFESRSSRG